MQYKDFLHSPHCCLLICQIFSLLQSLSISFLSSKRCSITPSKNLAPLNNIISPPEILFLKYSRTSVGFSNFSIILLESSCVNFGYVYLETLGPIKITLSGLV